MGALQFITGIHDMFTTSSGPGPDTEERQPWTQEPPLLLTSTPISDGATDPAPQTPGRPATRTFLSPPDTSQLASADGEDLQRTFAA